MMRSLVLVNICVSILFHYSRLKVISHSEAIFDGSAEDGDELTPEPSMRPPTIDRVKLKSSTTAITQTEPDQDVVSKSSLSKKKLARKTSTKERPAKEKVVGMGNVAEQRAAKRMPSKNEEKDAKVSTGQTAHKAEAGNGKDEANKGKGPDNSQKPIGLSPVETPIMNAISAPFTVLDDSPSVSVPSQSFGFDVGFDVDFFDASQLTPLQESVPASSKYSQMPCDAND
jgi:hypothetical protein